MYIPTQAKNNTVRFVEDIVNEALKFLVENKTPEGNYPLHKLESFFEEHSYASDRTIKKYTRLTLARVKFLA
jgi:hypothetical protein